MILLYLSFVPYLSSGKDSNTRGVNPTKDKKSEVSSTVKTNPVTPPRKAAAVTPQNQFLDEDSLWSSFLDSGEKKSKTKVAPVKNYQRTKSRTTDENKSETLNNVTRPSGLQTAQKTKPQRKQSGKGKNEETKIGENEGRSMRAAESGSSTTDDEKVTEGLSKRTSVKPEKINSKQSSSRTSRQVKSEGENSNKLKEGGQETKSEARLPAVREPCDEVQEKELSTIQTRESTGQRVPKDGSNSDEPESVKSDSDFVVINDLTQSENSLCMFDNRESSDTHSPKHITYSSNGKRSPTDSDYSIISEGRFHDMTDSIHGHGPIEVITNTDEASVSCSQRTSPAYSADAESEDLDDKSSPSTDERGRSGSEADQIREEQIREEQTREEGVVTPTPGEAEETGELSISGHTESSLTDVVPDECIKPDGSEEEGKH